MLWSGSTPRLEQVTESPHGADLHAMRFELRAQPRDVHLDRVLAELLVPARERLHDALLRERHARLRRKELDEKMVAVIPGGAFGADGNIRLSYACSMQNIEKGLDRLDEFAKAL